MTSDPDTDDVRGVGPAALGLTVAAVARRLGVAPATLRTWDRRYGLGPSSHTAGAHRRYIAEDVARLELMRRLVIAGVPPADAARTARDTPLDPGAVAPIAEMPAAATEPRLTRIEPVAADDVPLLLEIAESPPSGRHGGGRVVAIPGGTPAARGLARAALSLDAVACVEIVEGTVARRGVIWTWDHLLVPVLIGVGQRWEQTGRGVEVEHLLSESIVGVLKTVAQRLRNPVNSRTVLLACADEEQHSLPLFAVAAGLAERRIGSRVLGARVPADSLISAVRRTGPAAVLVWSHLPPTGDETALAGLPEVRPAPLLLAGGSGWGDALPPGVSRTTDLTDAVTRISAAVGA